MSKKDDKKGKKKPAIVFTDAPGAGRSKLFSEFAKQLKKNLKKQKISPELRRALDQILKKKGEPPFIVTGRSGVGKTESINEMRAQYISKEFEDFIEGVKNAPLSEEFRKNLAKHFGDKATHLVFTTNEVSPLSSDDALKKFMQQNRPEFINRLGTVKILPLTSDQKEVFIKSLLKSGSYTLSKRSTMAKVAAELQEPENKEMSPREILSLLTEKGLLKKAKNKPTKGSKPR